MMWLKTTTFQDYRRLFLNYNLWFAQIWKSFKNCGKHLDHTEMLTVISEFREMTISVLIEKLMECGVKRKDIELLCANGLHRKWTRKELGEIIGMDRALKTPPKKTLLPRRRRPR